MRTIRQPGPAAAERAVTVPAAALPIEGTLAPGVPLLEALDDLRRDAGADSACLRLRGGGFDAFAYVIPALAPDTEHAAFYSDTIRPAGPTALVEAAVTVGWRDGAPFFHAHGVWVEADGSRRGGHLLPAETVIGAPIQAEGVGVVGARFEARADPETGFRLFEPVPTTAAPPLRGRSGVALRLRPNQDVTSALEGIGRAAGFGVGVLHGGVGSIIGARYTAGPSVTAFATEMLVRDGRIRSDPTAGPPSQLDVALVDLTGRLSEGVLVAGDNPILMTLEAVLTAA